MLIHDKDHSIQIPLEEKPYPEELKGSWVSITNVAGHPKIAAICCLYFTSDYPSGTLIVSDYLFDRYPDAYGTWDKDYNTGKSFCSPKLRRSGKAKKFLVVTAQFVTFLGGELQYTYGDHQNGDFLVRGAYALDKNNEEKVVDDLNMFDFRDPASPVIHFDKRFIKYEE